MSALMDAILSLTTRLRPMEIMELYTFAGRFTASLVEGAETTPLTLRTVFIGGSGEGPMLVGAFLSPGMRPELLMTISKEETGYRVEFLRRSWGELNISKDEAAYQTFVALTDPTGAGAALGYLTDVFPYEEEPAT